MMEQILNFIPWIGDKIHGYFRGKPKIEVTVIPITFYGRFPDSLYTGKTTFYFEVDIRNVGETRTTLYDAHLLIDKSEFRSTKIKSDAYLGINKIKSDPIKKVFNPGESEKIKLLFKSFLDANTYLLDGKIILKFTHQVIERDFHIEGDVHKCANCGLDISISKLKWAPVTIYPAKGPIGATPQCPKCKEIGKWLPIV
jgi:hypothetical protein